jgi:hypothetical protein
MSSYLLISLILDKPERGLFTNTPTNKADWKRFFGMMDTLERNEIASFQNGRYLLHPKRKADVVAQAEAVLAEISKPLTLPEPVVAPVVVAEPALPQFNVCQTCKGKGRVNIQDALGFFGSFMCLTCYGEGQLPVPSRSTFPPVDLSVKPSLPNALLFSSDANIAPIPQALEVGGVRVIVEAASAPNTTASARYPIGWEDATEEEFEARKNDCDTCEGYGTLVINNIEQTCTVCNGTGEKPETPVVDSPSSELIATLAPLAAIALGDTQVFDAAEVPALVPADCSTCTGKGIVIDNSSGTDLRVQTCPECGGSGETDDTDYAQYPSVEEIQAAMAMDDDTQPLPVLDSPQDELAAKQFVRINTTGRGMSSGKYEVIRQEEKYGRSWTVVKFTTDKGLPHYFPAEKCELVAAPQATPKAIEVVIAPKPNLLEGLPIMQAIANHGVEDTKAALNVVTERVIAETLNGNNLLVAEGQA